MSSNVENKVVEFQFNNSNFEKNVGKSMSTLDKLKRALKFDDAEKSFKGLDKAVKDFDMSSMGSQTDGLGQKFSALQTIAVGALLRIGEQAVQTGQQLVKSLTIDQVAEGFNKYSQKVQATATIMSATGLSMAEVEAHLKDLNTYTDRTSYSFAQMVDNVGKFTSAGVDLSDAVKAMEGIGNWASLSGVSAASGKAAIAMYNLSQAMGQGVLMAQDWKSIENVNMATKEFKQTLIDSAVAIGELEVGADGLTYTLKGTEVSAENLRGTLRDGWATKDVMLDALMRYSDETDVLGQKAYKAAAEARTLEDAIGAVSDAISTSWMQSIEMVFGNYEEATKLWTGLQDYILGIFENSIAARNELLSGALKETPWDKLKETFDGLNVSTETFEDRIYECAKYHGEAVDQMINTQGSLKAAIMSGTLSTKYIAEAFSVYSNEMKRSAASTSLETREMTEYEKVLQRAINGSLGRGVDLQRNLTELGYDYNEVLAEMAKRSEDYALGIGWITDAQFEAIGLTRDEAREIARLGDIAFDSEGEVADLLNSIYKKSGRELIIESLYNALDGLVKIFGTVKDAWSQVFPPLTAEKLYDLITNFRELSDNFIITDETASKLKRTFAGLFSVVKIVGSFIKTGFTTAFDVFNGILGKSKTGILDITAGIGDFFVHLEGYIEKNKVFVQVFKEIGEWVTKAVTKIGEFFDTLKETEEVQRALSWISGVIEQVDKRFEGLFDTTNFLGRAMAFLVGVLGGGYEIARDWITGVFASLDFKALKSNVVDFFGNFGEIVKQLFSKDTMTRIKEAGFSIEGLKSVFEWFKEKVKTELDAASLSLKQFWGKITEWASGVSEAFGNAIKWVKEKLELLKKTISDNIGAIVPIILGAGIFGSLVGVTKLVKTVLAFFHPFSTLIDSIASLNKAKSFAIKMDAIGNLMKSIGTALLMVAGALKVIDMLKNPQRAIWTAVGIFGGLIVLVGIMAILQKKLEGPLGENVFDFKGVAASIMALGLGIMLIALSLKVIETLNPDKLIQDIVGLGAIIGALIFAYWAFEKIGGKGGDTKLSKGALFAVAMAGSVMIIARAMEKIGNMTWGEMIKSLTALIVIFGILAILAKISQKVTVGGALGLIAVGASFMLLAMAIKTFENIDMEAMGKFFIAFLPMLFAMFAMMGATALAGNNALGAAASIAAIGVAMLFLAKALQIVSKIDPDKLWNSVGAVSALLVAIAAPIMATALAGDNAIKASVTVLAVAGAVMVLAGAMWMISKIPADRLTQVMWTVVALIGALSVAIVASAFSGQASLGPLIVMTVALTILSSALYILANYTDPASLLASAMSIGTLLLALSASFWVLSKTGKLDKGVLGQLAVMVLIAGLLGGLIAAISMIPGDTNRAVAIAMSAGILLVVLSGVMFILNGIGTVSWAAIGQLAVLALIAAGIGAVIASIAMMEFDIDRAMALTIMISELLIVLTTVMLALGVVGLMGTAAFTGLAALGTLIIGLTVIFEIIGLLDKIPGNRQVIEAGIEVLKMMATGLGEAIGGFVDGILVGATKHLVEIGAKIAAFVAIIKTAFVGVDQGLLDAATTLAGVVLVFTAAEFLDGIARFFSGGNSGLDKFGEEIAGLGTSLADFNNNTSGIKNVSRFKKIAEAAKIIAEMAATMPTKFMTKTEMENFGSSMVAFSSSLQRFGVYAGSTNTDAVDKAATAGMKVAELANSLVKEGGVLQALAGETTDMDVFGEQLEKFGTHLVSFGEDVSGITDDHIAAMDNAIKMGEKINEFAGKLQTQGSFIGKVFGEKDLKQFGYQVWMFGAYMLLFAKAISGITEGDVTNAGYVSSIAEPLAAMCTQLNTHANWYDAFTEDMDLATWGSQVKAFGEGMVGYSEVLKDLDTTAVTDAGPTFRSIMQMAKEFGRDDPNGTGIGLAANQLADLAFEINNFAATLREAVGDDSLFNDMEEFATMMSSFGGENGLFTVGDGKDVTGEFLSSLTGMFSEALKKTEDFIDKFSDLGGQICDKLVEGINKNKDQVKTKSEEAARQGKQGVRSTYGDFFAAGQHVGSGIVRGLNSYNQPAYNAGKEVGDNVGRGFVEGIATYNQAAYNAGYALSNSSKRGSHDAVRSNSPSKDFIELGEFCGRPFVEHLLKYADPAYEAGYELGYGAKLGLDSSIDKMQAIIDGGVDVNPVITPVLDLTEIQNGVASMSGMFDNQYTILGSLDAPFVNVDAIRTNVRRSEDPTVKFTQDPMQTQNVTNNNTFNIQSTDPRAAAQEVSRVMQKQINKKESIWA